MIQGESDHSGIPGLERVGVGEGCYAAGSEERGLAP